MHMFRIATIPVYIFAALANLTVGATRLAQGESEAGFLYLILALLFVAFAVENIAKGRRKRNG